MSSIIIWQCVSMVIATLSAKKHKVYESFFNNLLLVLTNIDGPKRQGFDVYQNVKLPAGLFVKPLEAKQWFIQLYNNGPLWEECDNMLSSKSLWGRKYWTFMETVGSLINRENKPHIVKFLNDFQYILPCPDCQMHYSKLINRMRSKQLIRSLRTPLDVKRYISYCFQLRPWILNFGNDI